MRPALVSVISNTTLVLFKIIAGILTGSVSIISEAIHSSIDLAAAVMAYFSIRHADLPPDPSHPFGHGKIENLSALAESVLIILAALLIVREAIHKIQIGAELSMPAVAVTVMAVSAVVNFFVARYLFKAARKIDSPALEADAKHLSVDIYSSIAVMAAIVLVTLTGRPIFDPIAAICVSLLIFYEGVVLTKKAVGSLMDNSLPEEELDSIKKILESESKNIKDYHELRTRKAGRERHIDLHLIVCANETISKTHTTMDIIENRISSQLNNCNVIIHPEPCSMMTDMCPGECSWNNHNDKDNGGTKRG